MAYPPAALAIALTLLFAASFRWNFRYHGDVVVLGISHGRAQVITDPTWVHLRPDDPRIGLSTYALDSDDMVFANVHDAFFGLPREYMPDWYFVPLGVPTLAAGILAGVLIFLVRIRVPPGHCWACGYNLTGIERGRCPECGTELRSTRG